MGYLWQRKSRKNILQINSRYKVLLSPHKSFEMMFQTAQHLYIISFEYSSQYYCHHSVLAETKLGMYKTSPLLENCFHNLTLRSAYKCCKRLILSAFAFKPFLVGNLSGTNFLILAPRLSSLRCVYENETSRTRRLNKTCQVKFFF